MNKKTKDMVLTGMLFAAAIVLSIVEGTIPMPVPGVKFGLSNIVVMYTLFFLGRDKAVMIALLKGVFAGLSRGAVAGLVSTSGGLAALGIMIILSLLFQEKITRYMLSVFGAVFHNVGQFAAISLIYTGMNLWYYLPILLISGLLAGMLTSTLLKIVLPALRRLGLEEREDGSR